MASSRIISRLSSRLQPLAAKLNNKNASPLFSAASLLKPAANRRIISRLPVELSGLETMLPLHSAIASARLKSSLAAESQQWSLVVQGISMPL